MPTLKTHFILFVMLSAFLYSQDSTQQYVDQPPAERFDHALTVGILQGGGSLIGVDFEQLIGDRIGVQVGAGLVGFGAGINYHFQPTSNSSAISLQFWNQGTSGDNLGQRVVGITYIHRATTTGFTAQIGLGSVIERGKIMEDYYRDEGISNPPDIILMYSIGWYFK
jgi:hypothetical protein